VVGWGGFGRSRGVGVGGDMRVGAAIWGFGAGNGGFEEAGGEQVLRARVKGRGTGALIEG
jgi:hypothetical protein